MIKSKKNIWYYLLTNALKLCNQKYEYAAVKRELYTLYKYI